MTEARYLGMRPGDLDEKPYAKYWNPEMGSMPSHVQKALMRGVEAKELGFEITDANQLLDPGYLSLESGWTRLESGQVFVSILTKMPKVNGKMIDWWFAWNYMEDQRYKLWHPRAHVSERAEKMLGDDPNLSDREKYLDNPAYVVEYVGGESLDLVITLLDPSHYLDVSRFEEARIGTAICAKCGYTGKGLNFGLLIHLIRETEAGCEMRSRFWLGDIEVTWLPDKGILNRIASTKLVAKHAVPLDLGRDMLVHCAMEMNHLASFLPELYSDYHPAT